MSSTRDLGLLPDGRRVLAYRIERGGLAAEILDLGAIIRGLWLEGRVDSLILGADDPALYLGPMRYFGAVVGRFANRIGGGTFAIGERRIELDRNFLGRHTLHGGSIGSDAMSWNVTEHGAASLSLALEMPDGHMGFPGAMRVEVTYRLENDASFVVSIQAETTRASPCSFSQHSYFNLTDEEGIQDHLLAVSAESYLPVDRELIPTGEIRSVAGTEFDFSVLRRPGDFPYDHNYCLCDHARTVPEHAATLVSPDRRTTLSLETTEPGLQVYTGCAMKEVPGTRARPFAGIALEPQAWPDAVNRDGFPPAILMPGERYRHESRYRFSMARW